VLILAVPISQRLAHGYGRWPPRHTLPSSTAHSEVLVAVRHVGALPDDAARGRGHIARMMREPNRASQTSDAPLLLTSGIGPLVRHASSRLARRGGLLVRPG
jgi:hypothetical protein